MDQVLSRSTSSIPAPGSARSIDATPSPVAPLRFAVSLTTHDGRQIFRKQFATAMQADVFARSTADLCPDCKISSVDRIEGFAYELRGKSLTITSPRRSAA